MELQCVSQQEVMEESLKIMGLEVDSNDSDELVEERSQQLTTEEFMELHCVSQQKVMKERLKIMGLEVDKVMKERLKIMGLEVDGNDIDELVKEHNQQLTTEELMELHCVSQ
ncbi:hypothetical protein AVEN_41818-1 [Araneus ventricosus]|uniref:Uncharacterized protein n=1 Tax=Araneus ventricosus TaxID=182803 RepID=A0A4Y2AC25_ARAVE|nr:hypothetical protein AVEN_41818-1 [Araneus ventricosus]